MTRILSAFDMVFKGVAGTVPAAGSLKALWEGDTTENDYENITHEANYVTNTPAMSFKSQIVNDWADAFTIIDQVDLTLSPLLTT